MTDSEVVEARTEFQVVDADGCPINDAQPTLIRARVLKRTFERQCPHLGPFGIEHRVITTSEWEPTDG